MINNHGASYVLCLPLLKGHVEVDIWFLLTYGPLAFSFRFLLFAAPWPLREKTSKV